MLCVVLYILMHHMFIVRALVDALCRDGAGHVSRELCTNSPVSCPRSISGPEKIHQHHPETYLQLTQCFWVHTYLPLSTQAEFLTRRFLIPRVIIFFFFFFLLSKQLSAMVESIKSWNPTDTALKDGGGVHRHQANLNPTEYNRHEKPRARPTTTMNDAILDTSKVNRAHMSTAACTLVVFSAVLL